MKAKVYKLQEIRKYVNMAEQKINIVEKRMIYLEQKWAELSKFFILSVFFGVRIKLIFEIIYTV